MAKKKLDKKPTSKDGVWLYDQLTKVRFRVRDRAFEVDMGSEILVTAEEDIHFQVEKIPAILGYFGSITALLEKEHRNKEDIKRKLEGMIDKAVRNTGMTGEARIDKTIKRHPKWIEACASVNAARANWQRARYLYQALVIKASVLESRSADIRRVPSDSILGVAKADLLKIESD